MTLRNVPAFLYAREQSVTVDGLGELAYDMAFGGNFYAIVAAADAGVRVAASRAEELIEVGARVMTAIDANGAPVHPADE